MGMLLHKLVMQSGMLSCTLASWHVACHAALLLTQHTPRVHELSCHYNSLLQIDGFANSCKLPQAAAH
jgi:hypothetical protein